MGNTVSKRGNALSSKGSQMTGKASHCELEREIRCRERFVEDRMLQHTFSETEHVANPYPV